MVSAPLICNLNAKGALILFDGRKEEEVKKTLKMPEKPCRGFPKDWTVPEVLKAFAWLLQEENQEWLVLNSLNVASGRHIIIPNSSTRLDMAQHEPQNCLSVIVVTQDGMKPQKP